MPKKAAAKKGPVRTTGYRVESESYPSGMGCYAAQDLSDDYIEACTTIKIVGEYDTMEEAKETAIQERDYTCQFEGWAEEYYGDNDPPFFSSDGENYDQDENVHIYVVDIAKEAARTAKENVNKQKAIENARNSKPPAKKKTKTTSFGPTKGNFKPDMEIFSTQPFSSPWRRIARAFRLLPSWNWKVFLCLLDSALVRSKLRHAQSLSRKLGGTLH